MVLQESQAGLQAEADRKAAALLAHCRPTCQQITFRIDNRGTGAMLVPAGSKA
jgi:hypothetical protein